MATTAALLGACADTTAAVPQEYLDETTAATITVVSDTLVFARERPELAAHARDYVTLVAVDVNQAGHHALHLVGYAWSTLQPQVTTDMNAAFVLVLNDRSATLGALPKGLVSIGMSAPPLPPPSRYSATLTAPIDAAWLAALQDATGAYVARTGADLSAHYTLWRVDRRS